MLELKRFDAYLYKTDIKWLKIETKNLLGWTFT